MNAPEDRGSERVRVLGKRASEYGPATTRIFRILVGAFGPAAVAFGLLAVTAIRDQFSLTALWWTVPSLVLTLAVPVVAAAFAWWASVGTLRMLMAVTAAGYGIAMLTLWPALGESMIPAGASPWILALSALGTTAAAIAWRPLVAWVFIAAVSGLTVLDRLVAGGPALALTATQDGLYSALFCSVFAALALVSIRAGRAADAASATARTETAAAAATAARVRETARIDGLVHDTILTTLLAAARGPDGYRQEVREGARLALAQIDRLRAGAAESVQLNGRGLVWSLQSITTQLAPEAVFSYDASDDVTVPPGVGEAFGEAMAEAVRNSLRHAAPPGHPVGHAAGHAVHRAVHVLVRRGIIEVTVLDDGVGFVTSAVAETRLGLAVSIIGRMSSIVGGRATIVSEVGEGTRVILEWRAV